MITCSHGSVSVQRIQTPSIVVLHTCDNGKQLHACHRDQGNSMQLSLCLIRKEVLKQGAAA
jgi:hypothetical protein